MPARTLRKYGKQNASKRMLQSQSRKNYTKKQQRGGDVGRYSFPPPYFGGNSNGYFANGSCELNNSGQRAVSQGIISSNGLSAGPQLYSTLRGGNCGCNNRKQYNQNIIKGLKPSKSRAYKHSPHIKSRNNRRH